MGDAVAASENIILILLFAVVALLYASVGQAGATGYLAVMGLFGMPPTSMKVSALSLNLLVATIGTVQFLRMQSINLRIVWPFVMTAVPFAMLGGAVDLPQEAFSSVVGGILLLAAFQMARGAFGVRKTSIVIEKPPDLPIALIAGAAIGFLSGSTGTGGGVFLAPVMLALSCGTIRQVAAATAIFNLMTSASALLGARAIWNALPEQMSLWLLSVGIGGIVGARFGSRYASEAWLRGILALLLTFSGVKLLFA